MAEEDDGPSGDDTSVSSRSENTDFAKLLSSDFMQRVFGISVDNRSIEERIIADINKPSLNHDFFGGMGNYDYGNTWGKNWTDPENLPKQHKDYSNLYDNFENGKITLFKVIENDLSLINQPNIFKNSSTLIEIVVTSRPNESLKSPGSFGLLAVTITSVVITTPGSNILNVFSYSTLGPSYYEGTKPDTYATLAISGMVVDSARLSSQPSLLSAGYMSLGYAKLNIPYGLYGDIVVTTNTTWLIPHPTGFMGYNQTVKVKVKR